MKTIVVTLALTLLSWQGTAVPTGPITPRDLELSLQAPPRGAAAEALAARIRASFGEGVDLKLGEHAPLIEGELVAFVVESAADGPAPRVTGMVNHGRGLDMLPIGTTGLWVRVEPIPTDTKFSFGFEAGDRDFGGRTVEMPDWSYPPESSPRPGAKAGSYRPLTFRSRTFNNDRTGWIYVPAAHDPDGPPSAVMIFQDGDAYRREHVGTVVDNLIADGAMPVTIVVGLNPGINDDGSRNRSREYDTLDGRYAAFLVDEVLPMVGKEFKLRDDPAGRAIGGASSGGICAFNTAWERPDVFGRVLSQIGSFTDIQGGHVYPTRVRESPKKQIKVFLSDGTNDLINEHGDWWHSNEAMFAALHEKDYDVEFLRDRGFHAYWTCGRQLPTALRWLWSDAAPKAEARP